MENGSSTATKCLRKSSAETISAHAVRANASKNAVSRKAAFDGVNRDYFFQGLNNLSPFGLELPNGLFICHKLSATTRTCLPIGPADAEIIDPITSELELL